MAPVGRTRTPKPGSFESHTVYSFSRAARRSTTLLVICPAMVTSPQVCGATPGQHRKSIPGKRTKSRYARKCPLQADFSTSGNLEEAQGIGRPKNGIQEV